MLDEHDDVLVESNNENVMESVNVVECETSKGGDLNVHEVGILFKDEKEMYEFHKKYAHAVGFPVKKMNSKKGYDGY